MNVKVFHLISEVHETKFLVQHESCQCKQGLNENICNSMHKWNHDACWCKCKESDHYNGILVYVIVSVIMHLKLMNIQILQIAHVKKGLFGKLGLACEDEILNTNETLLNDKKVT